MIKDNARYTAMRLFQEIEGAEVIYINAYAATAPRLPVFRSICNNIKDNGEDQTSFDDLYEDDDSDLSTSNSNDSYSPVIEDQVSVFSTIKHQLASRK